DDKMLGVTPEMAFFFYSFFKLSIFCRSDEKFDGVCQQLQIVPRCGKRRLCRRLFSCPGIPRRNGGYMQFFSSAIDTLQTLVVALGAGLGVWGVVNLLEGYGSDNPGANAH